MARKKSFVDPQDGKPKFERPISEQGAKHIAQKTGGIPEGGINPMIFHNPPEEPIRKNR